MKIKFLFIVLSLPLLCLSQTGEILQNYGIQPNFDNQVTAIKKQNDNKILIGGRFSSYNGLVYARLIRLNLNGTVDLSFNIGLGFNNIIESIAIQSDGKVLIGGSFTTFNGNSQNRIVRINPNGTIDNSFVIGTGFNAGLIRAIEVQNDGKIIVAGSFLTNYNGNNINNIIRLNPNGSIDTSFNPSLSSLSEVNCINILSNNKILIGGNNIFKRLNSDGSEDLNFLAQNFDGSIHDIKLQTDGKIIVGGAFSTFNSLPKNNLTRLNNDGTTDNSFDIGTGFNSAVNDIEIFEDQKLIIGGIFTSYNSFTSNKIILLNANGSIDTNFNNEEGFSLVGNTNNVSSSVDDIEVVNGSLFIGGLFDSFNNQPQNNLIRINGSSSNLQSFNFGLGFNNVIFDILTEDNDKIIVAGQFSVYKGNFENGIIRLNNDGTKDNSFNADASLEPNFNHIERLPDGKYLIGGENIAKLNQNGSVDATFNIEAIVDFSNDLLLQNDGKFIVVGSFEINNTTYNIARFNSDGTLDTSFSLGLGFNSEPICLALQSDGKILVGGNFTTFNGQPANRIIRLNSNGTRDNSFNNGTGFNNGNVTVILPDDAGKLVIGGSFTSFNGINRNRIIRLNQDGSIDNSFEINAGFNSFVNSMIKQPDGKILIVGNFTSYNNISCSRIVRLNNNGSLDNSFNSGSGFDFSTICISLQSSGDIIVGGRFINYNGNNESSYLIKLSGDLLSNQNFIATQHILVIPNPVKDILTLSTSKPINSLKIYDLTGKFLQESTESTVSVNFLSNGIYFIKATTIEGKEINLKFIKE